MFEIDRKEFGAFVASLRKEQGLTQKELAEKLYISDKAVSKWETGCSIPDTTLLIPLADILGVTVTELLECRRSEQETLAAADAEVLVQKALRFSGETQPNRRKNAPVVAGAAILGGLENLMLHLAGYPKELAMDSLFLMYILPLIFGIYFWLFLRERLPAYYDENRIYVYGDHGFRLNLPGIALNNSNWPHIVRVGRIWTLTALVGSPLVFGVLFFLFPQALYTWAERAILLIVLVGLFVPMFWTAKKYEYTPLADTITP